MIAPRRLLPSLLLALVLWPATARAQVIGEGPPPPFPDPKKYSRGFFAEGDVGAEVFLGKLQEYATPGPSFAVRVGYDVLRWFALQAHVGGTLSSAESAASQVGQSFQLYSYTGELRFQVQFRRVGLYLLGGAGLGQISSNVLDAPRPPDKTGVTNQRKTLSLATIAGIGVDLHTLNRHFSLGVAGDFTYLSDFDSAYALTFSAYLKYTY